MTKHRTTILAGATLAALALPAVAQAHDAEIRCDLQRPGQYVVTPDYLHLNPVTTFGPAGAVVTWSDGYVVRLPYPTGCPVPPPPPVQPPATPTPAPAPAQVVPVVGTTPAPPPRTCAELLGLYPKAGPARRAAWGCPVAVPPTTPPTTQRRTSRIVEIHACTGVGTRRWVTHLVTTTWRRGDAVLKVKRSRVREYGAPCALPPVTA